MNNIKLSKDVLAKSHTFITDELCNLVHVHQRRLDAIGTIVR